LIKNLDNYEVIVVTIIGCFNLYIFQPFLWVVDLLKRRIHEGRKFGKVVRWRFARNARRCVVRFCKHKPI